MEVGKSLPSGSRRRVTPSSLSATENAFSKLSKALLGFSEGMSMSSGLKWYKQD